MLTKSFSFWAKLSIAAGLFFSSAAHAGFYLEGALAPIWHEDNIANGYSGGSFPGDVDAKTAAKTGYDARMTLGYIYNESFMVGFTYNSMGWSQKRDASATNDGMDNKAASSEYGPMIGLLMGGWRFTATYVLAGEQTIAAKLTDTAGATNGDREYTNKGASGWLIGFGYSFALTKHISIGPTLIYRTVSYSTQSLKDKVTPSNDYADKSFSVKSTDTDLAPFLSLVARF